MGHFFYTYFRFILGKGVIGREGRKGKLYSLSIFSGSVGESNVLAVVRINQFCSPKNVGLFVDFLFWFCND